MQEDYDFDWNHARRSKSKMSLFSATSSPSSRAGLGTVFNLTIFCLIKNVLCFFINFSNNMITYKCQLLSYLQLNEYETDRYFLKNFQCATMLIHVFCKTCEPEIVLQECKSKQKQFQVHNSYKTHE